MTFCKSIARLSVRNKCLLGRKPGRSLTALLPALLLCLLADTLFIHSSLAQVLTDTETTGTPVVDVSQRRMPRRLADLRPVRLIVNGEPRGRVMVLPIPEEGEASSTKLQPRVMVPVRAIIEAIGWNVDTWVQKPPDPTVRWVEFIAPYKMAVSHQDMSPEEFGQESSPHIVVEVETGYIGIMSPYWEMGESIVSKPLPEVIDGRVYVRLGSLADALEMLVGRVGKAVEFHMPSGTTSKGISETGGLISYLPEDKELRIRYVPRKLDSRLD